MKAYIIVLVSTALSCKLWFVRMRGADCQMRYANQDCTSLARIPLADLQSKYVIIDRV